MNIEKIELYKNTALWPKYVPQKDLKELYQYLLENYPGDSKEDQSLLKGFLKDIAVGNTDSLITRINKMVLNADDEQLKNKLMIQLATYTSETHYTITEVTASGSVKKHHIADAETAYKKFNDIDAAHKTLSFNWHNKDYLQLSNDIFYDVSNYPDVPNTRTRPALTQSFLKIAQLVKEDNEHPKVVHKRIKSNLVSKKLFLQSIEKASTMQNKNNEHEL